MFLGFEIFTLKMKRPKKLKKIIHSMVFLWAPIYIKRQPGYQIQIRFEMWRDLNCECLFIRTNLIVHKGNGAEISEFCRGFVRRVKWKGPLNWIDHQKSLRFLTAVSSCLLPYYIRKVIIYIEITQGDIFMEQKTWFELVLEGMAILKKKWGGLWATFEDGLFNFSGAKKIKLF